MLGASAGSDIRLRGYALDQLGFGEFKKLNGLRSRDRREVAKEVVERVIILDIIEQGLDGNARTREAGRAVHNIEPYRNHAGEAYLLFNGHIHNVIYIWSLSKSGARGNGFRGMRPARGF